MNNLVNDALCIPVDAPGQTLSINSVVIDVPGRPIQLEMRITAPVEGDSLPVILFSQGKSARSGCVPIVTLLPVEHGSAGDTKPGGVRCSRGNFRAAGSRGCGLAQCATSLARFGAEVPCAPAGVRSTRQTSLRRHSKGRS